MRSGSLLATVAAAAAIAPPTGGRSPLSVSPLTASLAPTVSLSQAGGGLLKLPTLPAHVRINGSSLRPNCSRPPRRSSGTDEFGAFWADSLRCTVGRENIDYSVRVYNSDEDEDGALAIFELVLPDGAQGLGHPFVRAQLAPVQFAPWPAMHVRPGGPLARPDMACLCAGGDKAHLYAYQGSASGGGVLNMTGPVWPGPGHQARSGTHHCASLSGGPATVLWKNPDDTMLTMIATPANQFRLNFHRVSNLTSEGGGAAWTFGVSGDVDAVPAGFQQRTALYVSRSAGPTAAWDRFGAKLRNATSTRRRVSEDVFASTVTVFTDNGAGTYGQAWPSNATPPSYVGSGGGVYGNYSWERIGSATLAAVASQVEATGVAVRGIQLDDWFYPFNRSGGFAMLCGTDWIPPERFFPGGLGGLSQLARVPLMLYLPAICGPTGGIWGPSGTSYTWDDSGCKDNLAGGCGWLLPVAQDSKRFFGDLFDYGRNLTRPPPQPRPTDSDTSNSGGGGGAWMPPMVRAAWRDTHFAAYETDFFWGLMSSMQQIRTVAEAGEMWLQGLNAAATARNVSVQLCGANGADLLASLGKNSLTQARSSIDYALSFDVPDKTLNGLHNWAAADSAWLFWAVGIAPSKDNFWTEPTVPPGYHPDSDRVGKDAELNAIAALCSTGAVGIGDWHSGQTNATLMHRLAASNGLLLKPDRPLVPLTSMLHGLLNINGGLTVPQWKAGSRLWGTHSSCATQDSGIAPELATEPTRRLSGHASIAAAAAMPVPAALASLTQVYVQWSVVAVDLPAQTAITPVFDLYPPPRRTHLLKRLATWQPCRDGTDAVESKCVAVVEATAAMALSTRAPDALGCAPGTCNHSASLLHLWEADTASAVVLLGDLTRFIPLSGYRFRLGSNRRTLIVVGSPREHVVVTYLVVRAGDNDATNETTPSWIVRVRTAEVGAAGWVAMDLKTDDEAAVAVDTLIGDDNNTPRLQYSDLQLKSDDDLRNRSLKRRCLSTGILLVCIDGSTITSMRVGTESWAVEGSSGFDTCGWTAAASTTVITAGDSSTVTSRRTCGNGTVTDTWSVVPGSTGILRWRTTFTSSSRKVFGPAWLQSHLTFLNASRHSKMWTTVGDFAPRSPDGYYGSWRLRNETFHLGQNEDAWDPLDGGMRDPSATIAVPVATHIDGQAALTFVQALNDTLLTADIRTVRNTLTCPVNSQTCEGFILANRNHRLTPSKPLSFTRFIVGHEPDWRPGLAFVVREWPSYFSASPEAGLNGLWGTGQYLDYRGQTDVNGTQLQSMGMTVNWDASFPFPFWGVWLGRTHPGQSSPSGFEGCVAVGHCDAKSNVSHPPRSGTPPPGVPPLAGAGSCEQFLFSNISGWYLKARRELGISTLLYANLHEFGYLLNTSAPNITAALCSASNFSAFCESNRVFLLHRAAFVRTQDYSTSNVWNGSQLQLGQFPIPPGVQVMDANVQAWADFQLRTLEWQIQMTPGSAGVCVDRIDHSSIFNPNGDDGVSWHYGNASFLALGTRRTACRMGSLLHGKAMAMFVSPTNPRVDLLEPFDGLYDEYGDRTDRGVLDGYISLNGRPCISWDHGGNRTSQEWHQYLQLKLYLGCSPTVPSPYGDHTLTNTTVVPLFQDYAPLFAALRGKRWLLEPLAVRSRYSHSGGPIWSNIFEVDVGVMVVVTAPLVSQRQSNETALVNLQRLPFDGVPTVTLLIPGQPNSLVPVDNASKTAHGLSLVLSTPLYYGGAVLILREPKAHSWVPSAQV